METRTDVRKGCILFTESIGSVRRSQDCTMEWQDCTMVFVLLPIAMMNVVPRIATQEVIFIKIDSFFNKNVKSS